MSRKANPAVVGIFVIGAVALLVAGVIIFGKGELFKDKREWVLYFEGSIKGLNPGSPVVFQGVRIGEVKDIRVLINQKSEIHTPVVMELDPSLISIENESRSKKEELAETKEMIKRGLRAQLQTQSLITGQLLIQLGFYPDKEARFVSPGGPLPEMPTIPSTVQELSKTLERLPLEEIVKNINEITEGLSALINSPELKTNMAALNATLVKVQSVMDKIDKQVEPISTDTQEVLTSAKNFLDANSDKIASLVTDLEKTSVTTRTEIKDLSDDLEAATIKTNEQLSNFLKTATATTDNAGDMLATQSQFRHELNKSLEELNAALRAIRLLAEYMEQHPESLIRGKSDK